MSTTRRLALLVLAAGLLSGCSLVPTGSTPVVINRHYVPFSLLGKTIPNTNNGKVRFITQPVYIVDATGHLAPSSRIVPSPPSLDSVLRELILGPTNIETLTGYTSALPRNLVILEASINAKHVGLISLTTSLSSLPDRQEVLALGQLAFTAHAVGASGGIEILVAGVAQGLRRPNGSHALLVTSRDYQSLLNP